MVNPLFNKKHIFEYLRYGFAAAVFYATFVALFLQNNKYENLYLIYIGNFVFMFIIALYTYTLVSRPYEGKRSVAMLIAGHLASIAGLVLSIGLSAVLISFYFPGWFAELPDEALIQNAPASLQLHNAFSLIFVTGINIVLVSGGGTSLIVVIISYAIKQNQTKDKPVSLEKRITGQPHLLP